MVRLNNYLWYCIFIYYTLYCIYKVIYRNYKKTEFIKKLILIFTNLISGIN